MDTRPAHVFFVAYNFPPDSTVGSVRPFRFYRYLKELGYPCTVLTATPQPDDCPEDVLWIPDPLLGIWEKPLAAPLSAAGQLERVIRRFVFPGGIGIIWSLRVAWRYGAVWRETARGRRPVLLTTFPPLGILTAGLLIALRERTLWIADFRDPLAIVTGRPFYSVFTRWMYALLEVCVFRWAKAVIANTEEMAAVWRERYPWIRLRLRVIWNGFDPEDLPQAEALPSRGERLIIHAGQLYEGRNPNLILWSLLRLRQAGTPEALRTRILLVGTISNSAQVDPELLRNRGVDDWLEFRKPVAKQEAMRLTSQADGLLLLQPQSQIQVPAKLFEYVAIGRPILALVPRDSAVERILSRAGVPYRCIYADDVPEAADRKLLEFLQLDTRPVRFSGWFEQHFNAREQTAELASIIEEICKA